MKLVVSADLHLRKDRPRCRIDEDWTGLQFKCLRFVVDLCLSEGASLAVVGDLFHTSVVQEEIKNRTIQELQRLPQNVYIMAGNHDLPYHQWENVERSSWGVLSKIFTSCGNLVLGPGFSLPQAAPFGKDHDPIFTVPGAQVVFTHQLTFPSEKDRPFPDVGRTAEELLEEYPDAKWIFTGDYHRAFHFEDGDRHVINPGCLTRQASDFIDYQPSVFLVDFTSNQVSRMFVPDTEKMVTDAYIRTEQERNERIESFVSTITRTGKLSLSFRDNLEAKMSKIKPALQGLTREILEELHAG